MSGVTAACIETTSRLGEEVVERRGWRRRRTGRWRCTSHAEPLEPPSRRPPDGAEADEARRPAGDLPAAEALVRDRAVPVHLARAHVPVGGHEVPGDGEQQGDGHLGDAVGVAAGRAQHRDALGGGAGHVDVGGVAAGRADGDERQVEHRARARVGLADQDGGAELGRPRRQLLLVEQPERLVVDPRVHHQLAELAEGVEPRSAQRGGGVDDLVTHGDLPIADKQPVSASGRRRWLVGEACLRRRISRAGSFHARAAPGRRRRRGRRGSCGRRGA